MYRPMQALNNFFLAILVICINLTCCSVIQMNVNSDIMDSLILSQSWLPSSCISFKSKGSNRRCLMPRNSQIWAIHGLWPDKKGPTMGPFFCNNSWSFDMDQLSSIMDDMHSQWPDIQKPNPSSFWGHEWSKHGTCAATLEYMDSQLKYFSKTLEVHKQYDMINYFRRMLIEPSNNGLTITNVQANLERLLGKKVFIKCFKHPETHNFYLHEIRLCFDLDLDLIDCTSGGSSCPSHSPALYPDNHDLLVGNIFNTSNANDQSNNYYTYEVYTSATHNGGANGHGPHGSGSDHTRVNASYGPTTAVHSHNYIERKFVMQLYMILKFLIWVFL